MISYAQNFEDVMLWRALGHVENGFYIDVGAQHPIEDSVSRAFYENGWRGIHIEPAQFYANLLRENRPDETVLQTAISTEAGVMKFFEIPGTGISTGDPAIAKQHRERGFPIHETTVSCITLASVFKSCAGKEIHWLKIDVEGMEKQVLEGWKPARARPWIVVVESTLPLTQIGSHDDWEPLILEKGYKFSYFDGLNRFYVSNAHAELIKAFLSGPNVFDGFVLSGTSSAPFFRAVQSRHNAELENKDFEIAAQIAARKEVGEQLREHKETIRRVEDERDNAAEEVVRGSEAFVAREQALERELLVQRDRIQWFNAEWQALRAAQKSRDERLDAAHAKAIQSAEALAIREREVSIELEGLRGIILHGQQAVSQLEDALKVEQREHKAQSELLRHALANAERANLALCATRSWRFTAPFRYLASFVSSGISPAALMDTHLINQETIFSGHIMSSDIQKQVQDVVAAANLGDLLVKFDQAFVACAYQTLLGRFPDSQGLAFYVQKLRRGAAKMQIIADIRRSNEGRGRKQSVIGVDAAIRNFQLGKMPLVGWMYRLVSDIEGNTSVERQLRAIQNQMAVFNDMVASRIADSESRMLARLGEIQQQQFMMVKTGKLTATREEMPTSEDFGPQLARSEKEKLMHEIESWKPCGDISARN
ncbi:MAG TPA: FkbM family methyltransferase [Usitatibacteraceae bacterium]